MRFTSQQGRVKTTTRGGARRGLRRSIPARSDGAHRRRPLSSAALALLLVGLASAPSFGAAAVPVAKMHLKGEGAASDRAWIFGLARRGDELWAVGSPGILVRRPGESAWTRVLSAVTRVPLDVAFAPSGAGVVVGQEGAIWEAAAGAEQWTPRDVKETQRLFAVAASDKGEFLAVGAFGAIWDRPAGSDDWRKVPTQWAQWDGPHLYDVLFLDDTSAVVVGERGTVLKIQDGAVANEKEYGDESLFAVVHCGSSLVAAGQAGLVMIGGLSSGWKDLHLPDKPDVYGLSCLGDNRVAATSAGFLLIGTAQGETWSWRKWENNSTRVGWYSGIIAKPDGEVLIAGQGDVWGGKIDLKAE